MNNSSKPAPVPGADASPGLDVDRLLQRMFGAAIETAQPALRVPSYLPRPPRGRTLVVGAGKASAAMARAVEDNWHGPLEGLVVTRYGHAVRCERIEIVEAAHPVADENGLAAARRMLRLVSGLSADDLVICLISGGGSSLLPLPAEGLTLQDKHEISHALLASGATISEVNCVRRHLSAIKGGRLAAACHPARVVNLIISDGPADAESDIASGPTVADTTTCADALAILRRYEICAAPAAIALLEAGVTETVKAGDARLPSIETHLIATPRLALEAAATHARDAGIDVHILGESMEGEARAIGTFMAGLAKQVRRRGQPFRAPCILLSGGEPRMSIRGEARGGGNAEFLLSLGVALNGEPGVFAIAGDTEGVDGREEIAVALLRPDMAERARARGIRASDSLQNNDALGFFQALGNSVAAGPTPANVNDFRAIFIAA